jgi:hypothetical protein
MFKAFVSSTYRDLRQHRAQAIDDLRKAGFHVDPMEDWTADSRPPARFSEQRLHGCSLCVLLVALRRGHVPDGETQSITQMEYRAALAQNIDVLVFMLPEDAPWPRQFDDLDKDPEIRRWRDELLERHGVGSFGYEPTSLVVGPAVTRWLSDHRAKPAPVAAQPPFVTQLHIDAEVDLEIWVDGAKRSEVRHDTGFSYGMTRARITPATELRLVGRGFERTLRPWTLCDPSEETCYLRIGRSSAAHVRISQEEYLACMGDESDVPQLRKTVLTDPTYSKRATAAERLGAIGHADCLEPLILALEDPHDYVAASAAWALGVLADPAALEPVRAAYEAYEKKESYGYMYEQAIQKLEFAEHARRLQE